MELLSFILGVTSVLLIFGILYIINISKTQNKLKKSIENNTKLVDSLSIDLGRSVEMDNRRIDGEIDRVNGIHRELSQLISTVDSNVNRKIDTMNKKIGEIPKTK